MTYRVTADPRVDFTFKGKQSVARLNVLFFCIVVICATLLWFTHSILWYELLLMSSCLFVGCALAVVFSKKRSSFSMRIRNSTFLADVRDFESTGPHRVQVEWHVHDVRRVDIEHGHRPVNLAVSAEPQPLRFLVVSGPENQVVRIPETLLGNRFDRVLDALRHQLLQTAAPDSLKSEERAEVVAGEHDSHDYHR